jgi:hypothetical protein
MRGLAKTLRGTAGFRQARSTSNVKYNSDNSDGVAPSTTVRVLDIIIIKYRELIDIGVILLKGIATVPLLSLTYLM